MNWRVCYLLVLKWNRFIFNSSVWGDQHIFLHTGLINSYLEVECASFLLALFFFLEKLHWIIGEEEIPDERQCHICKPNNKVDNDLLLVSLVPMKYEWPVVWPGALLMCHPVFEPDTSSTYLNTSLHVFSWTFCQMESYGYCPDFSFYWYYKFFVNAYFQHVECEKMISFPILI